MKTLFHTGGFVDLEDETAAAVLRYSLTLARHREMGTVTLDDASRPETRSQVLIVVGLGVPLSVHGIRSPDETQQVGDTVAEIDTRTERLDTPQLVAFENDPEDTSYEVDFDFDLL
ncbi:hypothetical protein GRS96_01650 [Rathayibacter sp. VKM Ac-2803]|uniref:hypothetical protein n=1 Tax=unclassified Rathayibacter TaxID=2609250 RepID=UPI001358DFFC|nr:MULTISPECIES: hypothetical protein [unclassified Rathayibacter]MWV47976.1 hypothetical protein [Rathayibacter sp. VKM Ac-2803]MWV58799.1 hypothetical protein [Rathayibacter sp. VKM Ac-2754]